MEEPDAVVLKCYYCNEEILANMNMENKLHCEFCSGNYPLEIRHKPLLECFRNRNFLLILRKIYVLSFKLLFSICCIFSIISLIIALISHETNIYIIIFMIHFSCTFLVVSCSYLLLPWILDWSERLYEVCCELHKSTKEWKVIIGYLNAIQETQV
ncbi:uncharacterized protein [Anoplolepis gracilipes]|uniref:uncharacterized protein isoform X2 n=1 Tax=Anoplolepis gracilipes TaxID=354296 RepID=UPI003B9E89E2